MPDTPQSPVRVLLLREVATGPVAAAFVAERWTREGSSLAVVKVLRDPTPADRLFPLQERSVLLGALRHRHIVTVDQVVDIDGHFGLLAPYVDGIDLLDWSGVLRENSVRMPPRVVAEIVRAIAVALDAAQNRVPWGEEAPLNLRHGDLKPGNVMIDRDGELKVLDFGTGASALAMDEIPAVRSAQSYVAPERFDGPPTHEADIYALGVIGIELLADRWLHGLPAEQAAHDAQLQDLVRSVPLEMRSDADTQTLRSVLLRMVAFDPAARPRAAVVAQTLRRLADRAPGPSLESFAHEHANPYLVNIPENPDTGLMVQVIPVWADSVLSLQAGPEPDADTQTMGPGELNRFIADDSISQAFLIEKRDAEGDPSLSLTDQVAVETEKAIEAARQARKLDLALDFDTLPFGDQVPVDALLASEEVEEIEADVVYDPPTVPSPRPAWQRAFLVGLVAAMMLGALIAIGAILLGLGIGIYLATA